MCLYLMSLKSKTFLSMLLCMFARTFCCCAYGIASKSDLRLIPL